MVAIGQQKARTGAMVYAGFLLLDIINSINRKR